MLLAAARLSSAGNAVVSVHPLSPDNGFLAARYRYPIGGPSAPAPLRAASVHHAGGVFTKCFAAAVAERIVVFPADAAAASAGAAKYEWAAHDTPITAMCTSHPAAMLATGAQSGDVAVWNLRDKFNVPLRKMRYPNASITAITFFGNAMLGAGTSDGHVAFWDLQHGPAPVVTIPLDPTQVRRLVVSPTGACIVALTLRGLYAIDAPAAGAGVTEIVAPFETQLSDVCFNSRTGELYACSAAGTIAVLGLAPL